MPAPLTSSASSSSLFSLTGHLLAQRYGHPARVHGSCILIQKHWRGYRERVRLPFRMSCFREWWQQLCQVEDTELWMAEQEELIAREEIDRDLLVQSVQAFYQQCAEFLESRFQPIPSIEIISAEQTARVKLISDEANERNGLVTEIQGWAHSWALVSTEGQLRRLCSREEGTNFQSLQRMFEFEVQTLRNNAAVKIQALFRGHCTRREFKVQYHLRQQELERQGYLDMVHGWSEDRAEILMSALREVIEIAAEEEISRNQMLEWFHTEHSRQEMMGIEGAMRRLFEEDEFDARVEQFQVLESVERVALMQNFRQQHDSMRDDFEMGCKNVALFQILTHETEGREEVCSHESESFMKIGENWMEIVEPFTRTQISNGVFQFLERLYERAEREAVSLRESEVRFELKIAHLTGLETYFRKVHWNTWLAHAQAQKNICDLTAVAYRLNEMHDAQVRQRLEIENDQTQNWDSICRLQLENIESLGRARILDGCKFSVFVYKQQLDESILEFQENAARQKILAEHATFLQPQYLVFILVRTQLRQKAYQAFGQFSWICALTYFHQQKAFSGQQEIFQLSEKSNRVAIQADEESDWRALIRTHGQGVRVVDIRRLRVVLVQAESIAREKVVVQQDYCRSTLMQVWYEGCIRVERRMEAAAKIQKVALRFITKCRYRDLQTRHHQATKIQAVWKGFAERRRFRRNLSLMEERKVMIDLQAIERKHIVMQQDREWNFLMTDFVAPFKASQRKRRELDAARVLSTAILRLQRWFRKILRKNRAKQARESLVERQERAAREVLRSEFQWQLQTMFGEYVSTYDKLWFAHHSVLSQVRIAKVWRGYRVRQHMPKFCAMKESVTSVKNLWKIERVFVEKEEHREWEALLWDERDDREMTIRDPGRNARLRLQQQKEMDQRLRELEKKQAEELKRQLRVQELQEELNEIIHEENLERRSLMREYKNALMEIQVPVMPKRLSSMASADQGFASTLPPNFAPTSARSRSTTPQLGPVRAPASARRVQTFLVDDTSSALMMAASTAGPSPVRPPTDELPALRRVPVRRTVLQYQPPTPPPAHPFSQTMPASFSSTQPPPPPTIPLVAKATPPAPRPVQPAERKQRKGSQSSSSSFASSPSCPQHYS